MGFNLKRMLGGFMFGGDKSASAPVDPTKDPNVLAAERTAQSNQQAQTAADYANRGTITDPYGTQTSTPRLVTDPASGRQYTTYDTTYTLNPQQQAALDAQQATDTGLSQLAQGMIGRAGEAVAQPFDTSTLQAWGATPQGGTLTGAGQGIMAGLNTASLGAMPQADAAERQRIENMLFDRMRPEHQRMQSELEASLLNSGLDRGSKQFSDELQRLQDQQSRARFDAMQTGGAEMERLFGMGMQGRQQSWQELLGAGQFQNEAQAQAFNQAMGQNAQNFGQNMQSAAYQNQLRGAQFGEGMQLRQMPLNELNALRSGTQVGRPDLQGYAPSQSAGGADYLSAQQMTYNAQKDAAAAKAAKSQGMMSGAGGIISAGIMAF